ncbi:MAG: MFS transporter [Anaerolineae bacterium]|nr:MAG: MFS transporter [Anaerolineae bacterium]
MSDEPRRNGGLRTFLIIWGGQVISMIGSSITGFALGVWVYQTTGKATPFVLVALFGALPTVLLGPIAGALVDRWDRRKIMILADVGSAFATLGILLLFLAGRLEVWHIYVSVAFNGLFGAFQEPAYSASVTMLIPKEHFGRATGLMQTGQALSGIIAPVLAGALFGVIGVEGIIVIDFITFFIAAGALLFVRIPQPKAKDEVDGSKPSLFKDALYGFQFLRERGGLLALVFYVALMNFAINSVIALMAPMVLAFSDPPTLGLVQTSGSAGMLIGGLIASAWGGPKRHILGVYGGALLSSVGLALAGLQAHGWWVAAAMFLFLFPIPVVNAGIRSIMGRKIPPEVQGRVFAIMILLARSGQPLGYAVSGPLADRLFEPLMATGGALAPTFGVWMGTGIGRGIGLMMLVAGVAMFLITLSLSGYPRLRNVQEELPDAIPDTPPVAA